MCATALAIGLLGSVSASAGGFTLTGRIDPARQYHSATLLPNGKVLVAGGYGSGGVGWLIDSQLYDPGKGEFETTGRLATRRDAHTATLLPNGKVLVAGGEEVNESGFSVLLSTAELYDPARGVFAPTGSMVTGRELHTATLLRDGKVLVVGGEDAKGLALASAETYDPAIGAFIATGSLNVGRYGHSATLLPDGRVLIAGGERIDDDGFDIALSSAEIYDPTTGRFHPTGNMRVARKHDTATLLNNGEVLIAGGEDNNGHALQSAELYDPSTGRFRLTGQMLSPHDSHAAALLSDGRVLIAGGFGGAVGVTREAELYNPASGGFESTGSMHEAREYFTATRMSDGRVLIVGGFGFNAATGFDVVGPCEIYSP
ncbi:MAG TPA: kelch repeat-containing protein [Candidatus Binataceae bacterium]|nr:kelch repeat-containing protein [Candidatus Binataceae bacterium]